ncbi:hypothetical protein DAPPUDRAFT_264293 [Daphnia pulex]|uniref:Uncharacterized protein n=1 Tax=Daphnia pulex TaxID=6669 RepID=E9HRA2_DAPPU|nr:hypothetical protein DAPPUDRAFT_264293 [Daphnia pulex]|eukprot:EFX65715.1 hypothetical protein DAPPUDRAFT_264293 [Daphnia pulex]
MKTDGGKENRRKKAMQVVLVAREVLVVLAFLNPQERTCHENLQFPKDACGSSETR